jgi:hypothetical protein
VLLPVLVYPLGHARRAERALAVELGSSGLTLACGLPLRPAERVRVLLEICGRVVRLTAEVRSVEWLGQAEEALAAPDCEGQAPGRPADAAPEQRARLRCLCELRLDTEALEPACRRVYDRFLCGLMLGESDDQVRMQALGMLLAS